MNSQINPQDLAAQAKNLLASVKQANNDFTSKTKTIISDINTNLKEIDKIDNELEKAQTDTINDVDKAILMSLLED